jgi:hypothetical protein
MLSVLAVTPAGVTRLVLWRSTLIRQLLPMLLAAQPALRASRDYTAAGAVDAAAFILSRDRDRSVSAGLRLPVARLVPEGAPDADGIDLHVLLHLPGAAPLTPGRQQATAADSIDESGRVSGGAGGAGGGGESGGDVGGDSGESSGGPGGAVPRRVTRTEKRKAERRVAAALTAAALEEGAAAPGATTSWAFA